MITMILGVMDSALELQLNGWLYVLPILTDLCVIQFLERLGARGG